MPTLKFTIDSALLRELGERLVGKPHIALAELVKNSYDADASQVMIEFLPDEDRIEVCDDGHGMNLDDFENFWMRIGTPHKGEKRLSKYLKRPMTGSKGVGRLAVQFLAEKLVIRTVPREGDGEWLEASVDWAEAVKAKELTEATVEYIEHTSSPPFKHGTSIILGALKNKWEIDSIRNLAGELWWLPPPFRYSSSERDNAKGDFIIHFQSTQQEYAEIFRKQIRAIMGIWTARLVGKNVDGKVTLALQFAGESPRRYEYNLKDLPHNNGQFDEKKNLNDGNFEIRFFRLTHRQPRGIKVGEAREYFAKYGGVHVYDGGFRLPYYGVADNDWLRIGFDSHRKNVSQLLPKELRVRRELTYLPTLGSIFGVVNVNTSREPNLKIMITRDRLADSTAFADLVSMVRYAIDLYANERAQREFERKKLEAPIKPTSLKFERVEKVLEYYESDIPLNVYHVLRESIREATTTAVTNQEIALKQMGLLGPLATAGISALAYQHELKKQFAYIEDIIEKIERFQIPSRKLQQNLESLSEDLSSWVERAQATNALFDYLADAENTKTQRRFLAIGVIRNVTAQTRFLARGIDIDMSKLDDQLRLPEASLVEWGAIFQNVFTNAFNAMLDSEERLLQVSSRASGGLREILVQDTGHGVNLQSADRLFEPFVRELKVSPERRALGYGGTGLGLTIVRLLADNIGCSVKFIEPEEGFKTAFSISWREIR